LLLAQSLRTTSTLFSTMLPHLKLQLELFLSYLIDRLTPPTPSPLPLHLLNAASRPASPAASVSESAANTDDQPSGAATPADVATPAASTPRPISLLPPVPGETKELMLETLTQIALRPSFMVDLWTNFDCSTESEDLFERLVGFLTRVSIGSISLDSI
jgi:brefeldin A-resistance guanine nucleotide exchange factor 1